MSASNWRRGIGGAAVAAALVVGVAGPATAQDRTPAPAAVRAVAQDVDYATWQRDVRAVVGQARPCVDARTGGAGGQRLAMVLDIDNTSLETDFSSAFPTPAVQPVLDLARFADSRGPTSSGPSPSTTWRPSATR